MSYRQGEMAASGDYYRSAGDPGLFGFLGKLAKGALGIVTGGASTVAGELVKTVVGGRGIQTVRQAAVNLQRAQSPIGGTLPPPPQLPRRFPGALGGAVVPFAGTGVSKAAMLREAGVPVKRRRMNVGNAKALRRAIRRARGFEKLARRVIGFSSPKKPTGRTYFRKTRARK